MTILSSPLMAGAVNAYTTFIKTRLDAGDDATALETALRAFDSGVSGDAVKGRLGYILEETKNIAGVINGQLEIAISNGGTGYSVGDVIPVTGTGTGAQVTVTTVAAGVIDGILVYGGYGYTGSPVADSTGVGGADALFNITVVDHVGILNTLKTAIASA